MKDLDQCLAEARQAGLSAVIGVGMDTASNKTILSIAEAWHGFVFPAIGYHPWGITKEAVESTLSFIDEHLVKCVALGEVGLDYKAKVKKELQRDVFRELLRLSVRYGKVPIVHCRYSHERVFAMITEEGVERAVFHWYTGSPDLLKRIIAAGHYISATPALQYSPPHQDAVRAAPLSSMLIETDCPVSYQGKESRPADVLITAAEVARLKGLPLAEVVTVTADSTRNLYGLNNFL
jgi:TatD DNase family protein